jgi:hypothetical protein
MILHNDEKTLKGQLPSIGKAAKKKEIIKNLEKHFLQIQVKLLLH